MTMETKQWAISRTYEDLELHVRARNANTSVIDYEVYSLIVYDDGDDSHPPLKFQKTVGGCNEITNDIEEAETLIKGMIKWDGCSHNNFSDGGYIHGCSREEMVRIGELFDRLFDIAMELMPGNGEYLT